MKNLRKILCSLSALVVASSGAAAAPSTERPAAPVVRAPDSKAIKEFLDLRFGMFIHFNLDTLAGYPVSGYLDPSAFNPGVVDTDAWADAAVSAGMKYAVLTAKHASGFCLWDSEYTTYDVMNPECPYGRDFVARFIKSFKSRGIKVGLYYLWRHPAYDKTPKYKVLPPECDPEKHDMKARIEFQKKQVAELLRKYPDVFYIWNDALDPLLMPADEARAFFQKQRPVLYSANWWDWNKKGLPYADIAVTEDKHFPAGNKLPGETCWHLEQDWFWTPRCRPASAQSIVAQLEAANARNANFLLNVAPDKHGRMGTESLKVLAEIGRLRKLKEKASSSAPTR